MKAYSAFRPVVLKGTIVSVFLFQVATARAGMTVYDLTDVARLRLEDISFFGFLLLIALMVGTNLGYWMAGAAYDGAGILFGLLR